MSIFEESKGNGVKDLKSALGLAVSMLSSEHIFSATLSSPWTTGKFINNPDNQNKEQDIQAFWTLFTEATVASVGFALVIGYLLHDMRALIFSLVGTAFIIIWMYFDYARAISGELYI